ncbi:MAG: hypothetical protein JST43_01285 [Bacteroidetes bacterium]|nr:hypothetical protein [Bacteroidota bacterium]MBS1540609.1 hypothetical protein [Bacteroidota bacterium]
MRVPAEYFRGIEYVQISSLPYEQQKFIRESVSYKSIITILKEDEFIHDCLQYQHYLLWYENEFKVKNAEAA